MDNQKDITERQLEEFPDVFADIMNVFIFKNRQVVRPEDLFEAKTKTAYAVGEKLHNLDRDIAKYWVRGGITLAKTCFENQTKHDPYITLRGFGYDGSDYREQVYLKTQRSPKQPGESGYKPDNQSTVSQPLYPIISIVLYYGREHWKKNLQLIDTVHFPDGYKEDLLPWFNDYRVNVVEMCHLTDEQINSFHSDFKLVAEYATKRDDPDYVPSDQEIIHKEAFFRLLSALEDDETFVEAWKEREALRAQGMKGGSDTMGSIVLKREFEKGKKEGFDLGEKHGFDLGETHSIMNTIAMLMRKLSMSSDDAMELLDISPERREAILKDPQFLSTLSQNN